MHTEGRSSPLRVFCETYKTHRFREKNAAKSPIFDVLPVQTSGTSEQSHFGLGDDLQGSSLEIARRTRRLSDTASTSAWMKMAGWELSCRARAQARAQARFLERKLGGAGPIRRG
jgi:hypothetical protein